MPLKLNVGVSKKVGEANYGSRGASVHFEVELEGNLVREPKQLREKIRYLFDQAQQAVQEELAGGEAASSSQQPSTGSNGSGHTGRLATRSQVRALHAIANRQRRDLAQELAERFHVQRAEDLSLRQASQLIDDLKEPPNGTGGSR